MQDILINNNFTPKIKSGDFEVGNSLEQHIALVMKSSPGDWRQNPLVGCALEDFLLDDVTDNEITQRVQLQLRLDGLPYKRIQTKEGIITVEV